VQAAYSMRFNVIGLANGMEKIFYHAGTCCGLNSDNTEGVFYEYNGDPRKIYAALVAFTDLFRPGCEPLGEMDWGEKVKAYLFREKDMVILAAWTRPGPEKTRVSWSDNRIVARDIMGNEMAGATVELGGTPVFLVAKGLTVEAFKAAVRSSGG